MPKFSDFIDDRILAEGYDTKASYKKCNGVLNCAACSTVKKNSKKNPDKEFVNGYLGKSVNYQPGGLVLLLDGVVDMNYKIIDREAAGVLKNTLDSSGLKDYYILPTIKCSLPVLDMKLTPKIKSNCSQISKYYIKDVLKPKVLIIDDISTFNALTGLKFYSAGKIANNITWNPELNCYMIVSLNAAKLQSETKFDKRKRLETVKLAGLAQAFANAKSILDGSYKDRIIRKEKVEYKKINFLTPPEEAESILNRILASSEVVVDIETTGLSCFKDKITYVGFAYGIGEAAVFPFEYLKKNPEKFKQFFESLTIRKIFANGQFDVSFLTYNGFPVKGPIDDILVMNYLMRNGIDYDQFMFGVQYAAKMKSKGYNTLKYITWMYTDLGGYEKELQDMGGIIEAQLELEAEEIFEEKELEDDVVIRAPANSMETFIKEEVNPDSKLQLSDMDSIKFTNERSINYLNTVEKYCATDCDATFRIKTALLPSLTGNLRKCYEELLIPLIYEVLVPMYLNGAFTDENYLNELMLKYLGTPEAPGILTKIETEFQAQIKKEMLEYGKFDLNTLEIVFPKEFKVFKEDRDSDYIAGDIEKLIRKLTVNINSPTQLIKIYKILGHLDPKAKSLEGNVLEHLSKEKKIHSAKLKADYQPNYKIYSTYVQSIKDKVIDGYIHASFNAFFSLTGRLSSENPNMQNFPASNEVRNIIIPRPGRSFIDRDFSQAELRVAAEYSMDDAMLKAFRDDADPHWDALMEVFGIKFAYRPEKVAGKYPEKTLADVKEFIGKLHDLSGLSDEEVYEKIVKQIKEWDELRATIKTIVFGVLYGASPYAIAQQLYPGKFDYYDEEKKQATLDECQSLIDKWFASKPKVKQWIESVHEFQKQHRFVETMFGRRRYLLFTNSNYWKFSSAALREGPNTKIQSTASDMCCMAAIYLQREINKYPEDDCRIINIVHDNIILEVPDEKIDFYNAIMAECMEVKANVLKHVKMQTSTQITKKWEK